MRTPAFIAALATLAIGGTAVAAPVTSVTFSPEFQTELTEDFGVREGEYLQESIEKSIRDALTRAGVSDAAALSIDVTVVSADPTRPTFQQLGDTPGLDYFGSVSVGGAELTAVIRGANGQVLGNVDHRYYAHSLTEISYASGTWSDARRSIRRFATKVADAYVANAR